MSGPNLIDSAYDHLQKASQQLDLAKTQLETARATYQSAKSLYEAVKASNGNSEGSSALERLCDSCAAVPISSIFDNASTKPQRRKVGDLFSAINTQSSCAFCKFLVESFQIGDPEHAGRLHTHLTARDTAIYFCSDQDNKPWFSKAGVGADLPSCPFVWLQTGPPTKTGEPHICISFQPNNSSASAASTNKAYPRRKAPLEAFNGAVNYELVQSWLQKCDNEHGSQCGHRYLDSGSTLTIQLIDVEKRCIVDAKVTDQYVALSYVWGKNPYAQSAWFASPTVTTNGSNAEPTTGHGASRALPYQVPQTIEDAMAFTKGIGELFLWVDLFCIDQTDSQAKRDQINAMDQIFASAHLTLVGLDGPEADWGLPGISRPLRQSYQPTVSLNAGRLTATYIYSVWDNNGKSVWDTRAWTLQERLLSRRCVIFADTYLSMTCQTEFFHDCMEMDLNTNGVKVWLADDYFREDGSGIDLDEQEWDFKTYDALVSVFTGRKLTEQTDVLNACRGSLNKITHNTGYNFHFGLPKDDLLRALLWKPHHDHVLSRRDGFPSWSWLGWSGRIEYAYWVGDMSAYATELQDEPATKRRRKRLFEPRRSHPESAEVTSYEPSLNELPAVQLRSMVAKFNLRLLRKDTTAHKNLGSKTQQSRTAIGDHWALVGSDGHALRNMAGEHQSFEPTDVFFRLKGEYSSILFYQESIAEFLFIHYWPGIRDSQASNKWLYDMVSALMMIRNDDGSASTYASVLVKAEEWYAQDPRPEIVTLV